MIPSLKFFWMTLCISLKSSALISNMTIVFKIFTPKLPKQGKFGTKFKVFFVLCETLHFDKFESADFKSGNNFFQIPA